VDDRQQVARRGREALLARLIPAGLVGAPQLDGQDGILARDELVHAVHQLNVERHIVREVNAGLDGRADAGKDTQRAGKGIIVE
jgi:hypothetical protein